MNEFITDLCVLQVAENTWKLKSPLMYRSKLYGGIVNVPEGFVTDFASVPRVPLAYLVAGNTAHKAAVVHDFLYQTQPCRRETCDKIFLEAMAAIGVPLWRRRIMYRAVRSFGWIPWKSGPERAANFGNRAHA